MDGPEDFQLVAKWHRYSTELLRSPPPSDSSGPVNRFSSVQEKCSSLSLGDDVHNLQRPTQQKSCKPTKVPEPLRKTKYVVSVVTVSRKWGAARAISKEENLVHTARS